MDSPFLIRTREMFLSGTPPVIFLQMPSVSESSPAHLHHVLGLYFLPRPTSASSR